MSGRGNEDVNQITNGVANVGICEKSFVKLPDFKKRNDSSLVVVVYNSQSIEKQAEDEDNLAMALVRTKADILVYQELRIGNKIYASQKEALDAICEKLNDHIANPNEKEHWKVASFHESHPSTGGLSIRGVGIFVKGTVKIVDNNVLKTKPNGIVEKDGVRFLEYAKALVKHGNTTFSLYSLYSEGQTNKAARFKAIKQHCVAESRICNAFPYLFIALQKSVTFPIWCGDLNLKPNEMIAFETEAREKENEKNEANNNEKSPTDAEIFSKIKDRLNPNWKTHKTGTTTVPAVVEWTKIDYVLVSQEYARHVICHKPQFPECSVQTHGLIVFELSKE